MRIPGFVPFRSSGFASGRGDVGKDAEALLSKWGNAAFDRATDLSWREDSGLITSPRPGHWWNVRHEVGRRLGQRTTDPVVDIAA